MRQSLIAFCSQHRILIDPLKYHQELLLKFLEDRLENAYQQKFRSLLEKYQDSIVEQQARWDKQGRFYEDLQVIAERRSNTNKAVKDFAKRERKQSKVSNRAAELTTVIKYQEFELFELWLRFNNYLAPIQESCETYSHRKSPPFRITAMQQYFEGGKQSVVNDRVEEIICPLEITFQNEQYQKHKIIICKTAQEAKKIQWEEIQQLQLRYPFATILFQTPSLLLYNYEASRIEIIGEVDGAHQRLAYCSNTLSHFSDRYNKDTVNIILSVLD